MSDELLPIIDEATSWLDIDGVEGVASGERDGAPCIVVGISLPVEVVQPQLPTSFHGYPVVLEDWGIISAGG